MKKIGFGLILFVIFYCVLIFIDIKGMNNKFRNKYLFISSLVFYFFLEYRFLLFMVLIVTYTYFLGRQAINSKKYIIINVLLNVFIFGIYKSSNIYISIVNELHESNILLNVIMPIGLSFSILKSISYVCDIYKGEVEKQDYTEVGLYIMFFPQIISGPISEPKKLMDQFNGNNRISSINFAEGIQIFFIGLFKKIVLADNINVFVSEIYRAPNIYSSLTVLLCVIGYSVEIYCDFSRS